MRLRNYLLEGLKIKPAHKKELKDVLKNTNKYRQSTGDVRSDHFEIMTRTGTMDLKNTVIYYDDSGVRQDSITLVGDAEWTKFKRNYK